MLFFLHRLSTNQWFHITFCQQNVSFMRVTSHELDNSNSKIIYLTKSTPMYQQDIINIQKMTLIVGRLLLWYNMYRFRESHPVNTNRQCHNCHIVYPLPWLAHWKANFEYSLFSLSSGWFHRIEYEEHWSFFDRRATRTILEVNQYWTVFCFAHVYFIRYAHRVQMGYIEMMSGWW